KILNIQLDKAHTRTDWSKRPLSPAQIRYASDDVLYLRQLYPELKKQLILQGREDWLEDEFEALCQADLYITLPEDAWKRVKGINRLRPRQLAAAINIAKWREEMAINKDRPRRWILSDDILLAIAQLLPKNISQLETIATINKSFIEKSGKTVLKCIEEALNLNESELPEIKIPKRLTAEQEVIADLLMTQVKLVAHEQNISSANICNRKTIEKMISGDAESPLLKGWRYKLAGEKIQKLLSGNFCLCIENNSVLLKEK
ncbi:MAG: HRDC domain-containing protein, partial [Gammaproteobacteria bacterium]|nr:HRDC domain-containing protein [Gammaproteobacteria bacterium]